MSTNQIQSATHNAMLTVQNNTGSLNELEVYWKIAEKAHQSGLTKVNSIFDAFFLVGYGNELGISPFSALRTIYVVNGVPTCSGEMMLALIRRSGLLASNTIEELTDSNGKFIGAKCTMKRKDTEETIGISFTLSDAQTAGLMNKQVWKSYPKNMCRWRAVSNVAKLLFGDVIGGLYTFEEIAHDTQQIDESGAPVGDIIDGTVSKPAQNNKQQKQPKDPIQFPQAGQGESQPEPPHTGDDQPPPEEQQATSWLQIPDNKEWFLQTMSNNNLDYKTFFKKIDPNASGWNDIARQYKDRNALEKAISDAMPKQTEEVEEAEIIDDEPTEEQYPNTFSIGDQFPDTWIDGAYEMVCATIGQYFDEPGDDLIRGGLGVESPEDEYSSPLELWNEVVTYAQETNVALISNQFIYRSHGKYGRIETYHPVLAVSFSRNKFVEMIGEKQFTDAHKIADWSEQDQPHKLERDLVISYETKVNAKSGKQYHTIASATIKPMDAPDADDLDEFFEV